MNEKALRGLVEDWRKRASEREADARDIPGGSRISEKLWARINTLREMADQLSAVLAAGEGEQPTSCVEVMPGAWHCLTCGFSLNRCVLRARDGAVGVNPGQTDEPCPNGCPGLLEPVTYKQAFADMVKVSESQVQRALKAEDRLAEVELGERALVEAGRLALEEIVSGLTDPDVAETKLREALAAYPPADAKLGTPATEQ